ncbi:TPA: nucleotide-binding protein [Stenotrophomonas maltophilia]|nr:nucleotide-binding protein [Stenotrophomonas maltophilia]
MIFRGTLENLIVQVELSGEISEVRESGAGHQLKMVDGAILNWYPTTGTISFQGSKSASDALRTRLEQTLSLPASNAPKSSSSSVSEVAPAKVEAKGKVFVVHGHDQATREQLELILHKLGLDPFVLQNTGGGGLTIIEALEKEIGPNPNAEVKFGIVLLTPDDFGYSKQDGAEKNQPRARQNVVLEMGMLLSAIGRTNVAILKKGHMEVPSDAQGILYLPFNDHVKEVVPRLVDRLTNAGFVLDPSSITKASS